MVELDTDCLRKIMNYADTDTLVSCRIASKAIYEGTHKLCNIHKFWRQYINAKKTFSTSTHPYHRKKMKLYAIIDILTKYENQKYWRLSYFFSRTIRDDIHINLNKFFKLNQIPIKRKRQCLKRLNIWLMEYYHTHKHNERFMMHLHAHTEMQTQIDKLLRTQKALRKI